MRTTLNARQWSRLRGYVSQLDGKAKADLLHRCNTWEQSVAKELSVIANGGVPNPFNMRGVTALNPDLVAQVAEWLKK